MAFSPNETYKDLSDAEVQNKYDQIMKQWMCFLEQEELTLKEGVDFFVNKRNMYEIIKRCDKRRVYMKLFHNLDPICEYKVIAVEVFWINTLKPFMVVNDKCSIYGSPNEMFCFYKIMTTIRGLYEDKYPDKEFHYPSPERIQDIIYDFKFCSFNREAMVGFIETFADTYGIGISHIFEQEKKKP